MLLKTASPKAVHGCVPRIVWCSANERGGKQAHVLCWQVGNLHCAGAVAMMPADAVSHVYCSMQVMVLPSFGHEYIVACRSWSYQCQGRRSPVAVATLGVSGRLSARKTWSRVLETCCVIQPWCTHKLKRWRSVSGASLSKQKRKLPASSLRMHNTQRQALKMLRQRALQKRSRSMLHSMSI